jgi:DNA gyrase subunit A
LLDDDRLVGVAVTDGGCDVMLATSDGKLIRFPESDVRAMGRTARGVRGIRLGRRARVISLMIASDGLVLTATENGYGKCTPADGYRQQGRAGMGLISIRTSRRNGSVVGAELVEGNDELMLITDGGKLVRTRVNEVSVLGRNTQGVKLISLSAGERLVGLERIVDDQDDLDGEPSESA